MIGMLLWLALFGLFYIYIGYPVLIAVAARLAGRPVVQGEPSMPVSVLIAAYNEEAAIAAKLRSLLEDGEGAEWIREILVGSDGSSDGTVAAVEAVGDPRVRVLAFSGRRGKAAVLNDLAAAAEAEVLVFTDARQPVLPGALAALLRNLADPAVGVVSGELVFTAGSEQSAAGQGMGVYWRYEKWIRRNEGIVHSIPGASGALYALRREWFRAIPPDSLIDDVVIPMQAVTQGARCVFESEARIADWASGTPREEAIRKRRTLAGCYQILFRYPGWLLPGRNPIWWQYGSHKIARLASPWLLVVVAAGSGLARGEPGVMGVVGAQAAGYGLAGLGWLLQGAGLSFRPASVCLMFVSMNLSTAAALIDAVRGRFKPAWDRSTAS